MAEFVLTRSYPHPPERVWSFLADSHNLAAWLMPNDFQPVVGHEFQMRSKPVPGFDGAIQCRVLALDPPRRMEWAWKSGTVDTVVSFALERLPDGTRLTLRQSGFRGAGGLAAMFFMRRGWKKKLLDRLNDAVPAS